MKVCIITNAQSSYVYAEKSDAKYHMAYTRRARTNRIECVFRNATRDAG